MNREWKMLEGAKVDYVEGHRFVLADETGRVLAFVVCTPLGWTYTTEGHAGGPFKTDYFAMQGAEEYLAKWGSK